MLRKMRLQQKQRRRSDHERFCTSPAVRPELVEGHIARRRLGFDRLSPNGLD